MHRYLLRNAPMPTPLTPKNLKQRARRAGLTVTRLAKMLGRHRSTVHLAVRYPERYGPTYRAIQTELTR
jgi:IS30 family transposase